MIYELDYLVGESKEGDLEKIKKEVSGIVTEAGGKFSEQQIIEKRKLAYKVEKEVRGSYIIQRFELAKIDESQENTLEQEQAIPRITRKLNLNPNILRFIIVKADDLPDLKEKKEPERPEIRKERFESRKERPAPKKEKEKTEKEALPESIDEKLEEILNI